MKFASVSYKHLFEGSSILKPNYHLNFGKNRINNGIKKGEKFSTLGELTFNIYTGGIFKRLFVDNSEYGLPYISAQHMMNSNPLEVAKLISKKYTPRQEDMTLYKNQILVSCAGTIGNVRLIGSDLEGVIGSQDIIRIIWDTEKSPLGFIYAYLASPTAYNYMQSFIYGSVVPRIEPKTLSTLPIPIFNKEIVNKCDRLIQKSVKAREDAIHLLKESVTLIENKLPDFDVDKIYKLKITEITNYRKRFESTLQVKAHNIFYDKLHNNNVKTFPISELSENVFTPNIFKRNKVSKSESSIPYTGGAELLNFRPKLDTFLSKNTKDLKQYLLHKGFIAIQDSGSIQSMGYVSLVPKFLDGVAATNNLVRVVPKKELNYNNYIFTFLKTSQANKMIKTLAYGTGQLHIDNKIISDFRVPIFDDIFTIITVKIDEYIRLLEVAHQAEKEAIDIIEKEIDLWQKS